MTDRDQPQRRRPVAAPARTRRTHSSPPHLARGTSLRSHQPSRERILDDLAAALALLQSEEPLLRRKFGLAWSEVASTVQDEAARRSVSTTAIARLLIAGLHADEARATTGSGSKAE